MHAYPLLFLLVLLSSCGENDKIEKDDVLKCIPNNGEKYLIVRTRSGLGNRIQAAASATFWAKLTNRKLLLDWEPQEKHMPVSYDQLFTSPKIASLKANSVFSPECTKALLEIGDEQQKSIEGMKWYKQISPGKYEPPITSLLVDSTPVAFLWPVEARMAAPVNFNQREAIRDFYKSLVPVEPVSQRVVDVLNQKTCDNKIGIHFRTFATKGDVGFHGKPTAVQEFITDIKNKITELKIPVNSGSCLYVASDDLKQRKFVEDEFKKDYGLKVLKMDLSQVERDTLAGQLDALVEFFLLGSMDYVFGSEGSTFSDEAGRLTTRGTKISVGVRAYEYHANYLEPL